LSAATAAAAAAAAAENENAKSKPLASTKDKLSTSHLTRLNTVHRMVGQERMLQDYYDIGSRIGGGGEANVFRAVHKTTGEYWAVKVTQLRNYRVGGKLPADLLKEAEIVRKLKHPHIVALKDVFMTTENLFLVMELCRGGDLLDRILDKKEKYADVVQERRRPAASADSVPPAPTNTHVHDGYTESEAQRVMQQLVEAISYMHTQNIAHRDLKPENIVLVSRDSDVDVKVTDFGLAKVIDNTNGFKTFCGTSHYIAPEVLRVQKDPKTKFGPGTSTSADMDAEVRYSLEADMWSLGVIMYVLLSGSFPFADDHGTAMNARILAGTYALTDPVWQGVSAQAKALMGRLLDINPDTRITAPQCLEHPWLVKRGEGNVLRGKGSVLRDMTDSASSTTDPSAKRLRYAASE
jgi:serine/threonine protein kinase